MDRLDQARGAAFPHMIRELLFHSGSDCLKSAGDTYAGGGAQAARGPALPGGLHPAEQPARGGRDRPRQRGRQALPETRRASAAAPRKGARAGRGGRCQSRQGARALLLLPLCLGRLREHAGT
jgi:hypothetical protein